MIKDALKYLQPNAAIPIDMETTIMLVNALKEALAQPPQPEQEPVAWYYPDGSPDQCTTNKAYAEMEPAWTPLYTHPPQRTEQETDELQSLRQFRDAAFLAHPNIDLDIEAAHGIKEDT